NGVGVPDRRILQGRLIRNGRDPRSIAARDEQCALDRLHRHEGLIRLECLNGGTPAHRSRFDWSWRSTVPSFSPLPGMKPAMESPPYDTRYPGGSMADVLGGGLHKTSTTRIEINAPGAAASSRGGAPKKP